MKLVMKALWQLLMNRKRKESIRMMNIQRSHTGKDNLIEEGQKNRY